MRNRFSTTRTRMLIGGIGLALAAAVLAAHSTHAAEAQRRGGGPGARMGGPGGGWPGGPLALPLRRLDLSDEQREQVRDLLGGNREEVRAHRREVRDTRAALAAAVISPTVDADRIRELAAELGRLEGDGAVRRAETYAAVWRILTPEQQARVEEMRERREERRAERMERRRERREERENRRDRAPDTEPPAAAEAPEADSR